MYPNQATHVVPNRFPTIIVGMGATAFISNSAWVPNLRASNHFDIVGAVTNPKISDDRAWVAANAHLPQQWVLGDPEVLIKRALETYGPDNLLVCVTTPTPLHADQICLALELGVQNIASDKPLVTELAELRKIQSAMMPGTDVWISFNHRYNGPIFHLREMVARDPGKVASIQAGFLQEWLYGDPHCPQGDWRILHRLCGMLDIGSHAADLASFIAGCNIVSVMNGIVQSVGPFAIERGFSDCGSAEFEFANGITGSARYHQSLKGHADDIWVVVTMKDGTKHMWRMAFGPETVYVSNGNKADMDTISDWTPNLRGHASIFSPVVNAIFSSTPGGHIQGWPDYWRGLFTGIAGKMLRKQNHPVVPFLTQAMQVPVPGIEDAGINIAGYVAAHDRSALEGGAEVKIANVL